jgi:hypothetical protein
MACSTSQIIPEEIDMKLTFVNVEEFHDLLRKYIKECEVDIMHHTYTVDSGKHVTVIGTILINGEAYGRLTHREDAEAYSGTSIETDLYNETT